MTEAVDDFPCSACLAGKRFFLPRGFPQECGKVSERTASDVAKSHCKPLFPVQLKLSTVRVELIVGNLVMAR